MHAPMPRWRVFRRHFRCLSCVTTCQTWHGWPCHADTDRANTPGGQKEEQWCEQELLNEKFCFLFLLWTSTICEDLLKLCMPVHWVQDIIMHCWELYYVLKYSCTLTVWSRIGHGLPCHELQKILCLLKGHHYHARTHTSWKDKRNALTARPPPVSCWFHVLHAFLACLERGGNGGLGGSSAGQFVAGILASSSLR